MASNDQIKHAVLDRIAGEKTWQRSWSSKFLVNGKLVHGRYCSPSRTAAPSTNSISIPILSVLIMSCGYAATLIATTCSQERPSSKCTKTQRDMLIGTMKTSE